MRSSSSPPAASPTSLVAEADEQERRYLARQLHDVVGQSLTAIGLKLTLLEDALTDDAVDAATEQLATTRKLVAETAKQVRDVMDALRPVVLDDYGLITALKWYGKRFSQRTGLNVDVVVEGEELLPQPAVERVLFRIVQEALSNVEHHANAQLVEVLVETRSTESSLRIVVSDDGDGFDGANAITTCDASRCGLAVMAGRASAVGCAFLIESSPGEGTKIIVEARLPSV